MHFRIPYGLILAAIFYGDCLKMYIYPVPPVEPSSRAPFGSEPQGRGQAEGSLPFESLMVRVPHHDPEHGGSIFLTTLSLSMGRRVRAGLRVSLPSIFLGVVSQSSHSRTLSLPFEGLRAVSLSNRSNRQVERQNARCVTMAVNSLDSQLGISSRAKL